MKRVAIITRALMMNGATKALVELLKRVHDNRFEIDLWVLDFSEKATEWIAEIPDYVKIRQIPTYAMLTPPENYCQF